MDNSHPNHLVVRVGLHGLGVFTTKAIKKGETVFTLQGTIIDKPTRTSVQIGDNKHIEDNLAGFLNHNCHPTTAVSRNKQALIALRDIEEGEEISFNYNINEDKTAEPFVCMCCKQTIAGRSNVSSKKKTTA